MTIRIIEALLWGAGSGIFATVYRGFLAYEQPFTRWWQFGARYEGTLIFKPVWGCGPCIAGQFALWTMAIIKFLPAWLKLSALPALFFLQPGKYIGGAVIGLFCLILAISAAILTTKLLLPLLENETTPGSVGFRINN